jgi:hypothetical protein
LRAAIGTPEGERRTVGSRALRLYPCHPVARLYLGHLYYDRGDWEAALRELEAVPPAEHWDPVSVWRLLELKRTLRNVESGDPSIRRWEARLEELDVEPDSVDELLEELEQRAAGSEPQLDLFGRLEAGPAHRVRTPDGRLLSGTWLEIVRQLRDTRGRPGESVAEFMRREADEELRRSGAVLPSDDPEAFLRVSARLGRLRIER